MATNAANARIFGSDNDAVSIAPIGTSLPGDLDDLSSPFQDAGWLSTDGITVGGESSVEKFRGHQGGRVIRTKITESDTTFQFQCLETTALTLGLQLNIRSVESVGSGAARARVSSGRRVEARVFVIDVYDDDDASIHYRYELDRGEIGERSEFVLSNSEITGYTFTVEAIGDFYLVTNDPAFVDEYDSGNGDNGGNPDGASSFVLADA